MGAAALLLGWRAFGRPRNLRGQVVFVTGGSRGLGFLLAQEFSRRGCDVVICARDAEELAYAASQIEGEVLGIVCDLTDRMQVEEAIRTATERFGRVDILVNNAGIITVGPLETMTVDDFERSMAVNFRGALYATLAVLPQMRARHDGRIVNITSIGG
jgi:NAD(P)-dependent dehydrogenase (short-subunit alcohol dehydrogenase family)